MFSPDEVFFKEFINMQKMRESKTRQDLYNMGLYDEPAMLDLIKLPKSVEKYALDEYDRKYERVYMQDIDDDIFSALNDTNALWWTKGQLTRRKFDYRGEFMKDADGNYLTEDVDIPTDCIAIISEINVHMPNKYISPTKEHFDYVDMIERTFDGNVIRNYIYIIPRKYCHKMYQTALVLSLRKLSKFYEAYALSFVNGFTVYLSSIPYKPTNQQKGRILHFFIF